MIHPTCKRLIEVDLDLHAAPIQPLDPADHERVA
jgi:hypothetical protein